MVVYVNVKLFKTDVNSLFCHARCVPEEPHLQPVAGVSPGGHASLAAGEPGILGHSVGQVKQLGLARLQGRTEGR